MLGPLPKNDLASRSSSTKSLRSTNKCWKLREREMAALLAGVSVEVPRVVPPPPPPPAEISLVLSNNLGNLPSRRAPLPTFVTFRGHTSCDKEQIRLLFGYAMLGRVPEQSSRILWLTSRRSLPAIAASHGPAVLHQGPHAPGVELVWPRS